MTPEERDLMVKMARSIDENGKAVKILMEERARNLGKKEIMDSMMRTHGHSVPISKEGGIMSTIEHDNNGTTFKVDVKFLGNEKMAQPDRMKQCEKFLVAMEAMFQDHGVVEFNGAYVRNIQG